MTIRRILCPIEIGEPSERGVLAYAVATAGELGARVHVLHAYGVPSNVFYPPIAGEEEALLSQGRDMLRALLADHPESEITGELRAGTPHEVIAGEVDRLDIDLVVMGTHTGARLRRFFLGSVAERVLRTCSAPVITVPLPSELRAGAPSSILVAHDLSERSRDALVQAHGLQRSLGAAISLVHVLPPSLDSHGRPTRRDYREALQRELLRDVEEVFGRESPVVTIRMVEGPIVEQILATQRELGADLLVVGATGKGGVDRVLLGSVATGLVRASDVPVLTVP